MHTYVSDVPLQVHNSRHLLSDAGLINGQSPVSADQLSQVDHELLIGPTRLPHTHTRMLIHDIHIHLTLLL